MIGGRERFRRRILAGFLLRFHMTLILTGVFLAGIVSNRLLLDVGVSSMAARWPLAVSLSYAVFFGLVWLWLGYVRASAEPRPVREGVFDAGDGIELGVDVADAGAGAGDSIDLDFDVEGLALVVLGLLLAVLLGAAAYLVWQAPAILADAAVEMALATGLIRATRRIDQPGWAGSIFRATAIPFVVMVGLAFGGGAFAEESCAGARTLGDVIRECV